MNKDIHIALDLTNTEVRTIHSIARNCRELCNISNNSAGHAELRKDLDTIIAKCDRALGRNQAKARCV
jgi:hypothetical protein